MKFPIRSFFRPYHHLYYTFELEREMIPSSNLMAKRHEAISNESAFQKYKKNSYCFLAT